MIALVASTPAFAEQVCTETATSKYCENAAENTISIENTVDVYSSRQHVWVCGAGIANKHDNAGSDNRLYYTATTFKKGRDVQYGSPVNDVVEAKADSKFDVYQSH